MLSRIMGAFPFSQLIPLPILPIPSTPPSTCLIDLQHHTEPCLISMTLVCPQGYPEPAWTWWELFGIW